MSGQGLRWILSSGPQILKFRPHPIEQIRFLKPRMDYGDIRALLGQFQFTKDMVGTKLASLSGGERARIALLKLLLEENNLLLR